MVIGFKENGKSLLITWKIITILLVFFWPLFKCILFMSANRPGVMKDPDHKVSTLYHLDIPTWCNITLFVTFFLDLYLGLGLAYIEEQESKKENTALNDVRVETDEERRPLFEPKENYGENITKNDNHVHGHGCQCRRFSCQFCSLRAHSYIT